MSDGEIGALNRAIRITAALGVVAGILYGSWLLGTVVFWVVVVLVSLLAMVVVISVTDVPGSRQNAPEQDIEDLIAQLPHDKQKQHRDRMALIDAAKKASQNHVPVEVQILKARADKAAREKTGRFDRSQSREFYEEVWSEIWDNFGSSPFTTSDIEALGNTEADANEVLTYLKARDALKTVGLRTFELSRAPEAPR